MNVLSVGKVCYDGLFSIWRVAGLVDKGEVGEHEEEQLGAGNFHHT